MITGPVRRIFRNDLLAGICLVVFSYLPLLFPNSRFNRFSSIIIGASYYLGVLLLGNYATVKLGGFSLISRIRGNRTNNRNFTKVILLGAIFFSLIAADLGGLWYFPYWTTTDYWFIGFLLGGWVFYVITLIVCYEAVKLMLDRVLKQKKRVSSYFSFEPRLYRSMLYAGIGCLAVVTAQALHTTKFFTDFNYTVGQPKAAYLSWYFWIVGFLGVFFITEYIEFRRKRSSLLKDTLHGYINPLLAIIITGLVLGVTNEIQNLSVYLWRYNNYPWPDVMIFHVPVFVLAAWPLHIAAFLMIWRAFGNGSSSVVFANSKTLKRKTRVRRRLALAHSRS